MNDEVTESLVVGKSTAERCEDVLHVSEQYIAIIDGPTSMTDYGEGKRPGRVIAQLLDELLFEMGPRLNASDFFGELSHRVAQGLAPIWHDQNERPSASMLVYSARHGEVWVLGDGWVSIDGNTRRFSIPYADAYTFLRCAFLHTRIALGTSVESLLECDEAHALVEPFIRNQQKMQNRLPSPYGYGVMDGSPECVRYVRVLPANQGQEVILASDGYPTIKPTLEATEVYLQRLLRRDPLMISDHPQIKGLRPGQISFDDRSYVRFTRLQRGNASHLAPNPPK